MTSVSPPKNQNCITMMSFFGSRTQHNSEPVISAPSNSHCRWFLNGLFTTSLNTCSCKAIPQNWPQGTCLWTDFHFYFWCQMFLKGIQHQHTQSFRCTPGCLFHTTANQSPVTSLVIQALNWHLYDDSPMQLRLCSYLHLWIICAGKLILSDYTVNILLLFIAQCFQFSSWSLIV